MNNRNDTQISGAKFWGFLLPTGLALKTNLKLPVFLILKDKETDQQNTL